MSRTKVTLERYDVDWWTAHLPDVSPEIRWQETELWPSMTSDQLAESLGTRWNQAVWIISWDGDRHLVVEVEPVPVTVYGVDGELHATAAGPVILL